MQKYKVNDIIKVKVTGILEYGFFVNTEDGYSGLCHISEISNDFVSNINDYVQESDEIYAQILDVDHENKHLKLSIKDIYYKTIDDDKHIVESRRGFLPLKNMLPIWIEEKMKEFRNNE